MQPQPVNAPVIRAHALYQMALGMWSDRSASDRDFGAIRLALGVPAPAAQLPALTVATDTPDIAYAVARGEVDVSVVNPSCWLTMAYRGTGPFAEPLPLLAIAVMPSWDLMAFAIAERTGLRTLAAIRERRYPLRVSVRAARSHATRFVIDEVLGSLGFSLHDIESWGGSIHSSPTPSDSSRLEGIRNGTLDAVFDEGITGWMPLALQAGLRPIPIGAEAQKRMTTLGWDVRSIPRARFPELEADVAAADFSGWPIFARNDVSEAAAYQMCRALDAARALIPWDSDEPVQLADLCGKSAAAPLGIPLHPGALRYYAEHGAL
jgi:TRAP-type uncharacterized transport system substrate-binding protein